MRRIRDEKKRVLPDTTMLIGVKRITATIVRAVINALPKELDLEIAPNFDLLRDKKAELDYFGKDIAIQIDLPFATGGSIHGSSPTHKHFYGNYA